MSKQDTPIVDEFELKSYQHTCDLLKEYLKKYKGMSWVEITYAVEEEEEEERRKLEEERKYLNSIGEYELEEGEVLD